VKDILLWVKNEFEDNVCMTSSFQTQSLPLLHQVSLYIPETEIIFIDTGFHFKETLEFKDKITKLLKLRTKTIKPSISKEEFFEKYGNDLYLRNPKLCCQINKVNPFLKAISNYKAWICGIRKDQTKNRLSSKKISVVFDNKIKVCPMISWNLENILNYVEENNLPKHPLYKKGYRSIGCKFCTEPVQSNENERNGRWKNNSLMKDKECGININDASLNTNII